MMHIYLKYRDNALGMCANARLSWIIDEMDVAKYLESTLVTGTFQLSHGGLHRVVGMPSPRVMKQ